MWQPCGRSTGAAGGETEEALQASPARDDEERTPFPLLLRAFPIGNGHFEVSDRESFLPFKLDPELLLSHRRSS